MEKFWSTGITLEWNGGNAWRARAGFEKGNHCQDGSMVLELRTKYHEPIGQAIDTLLAEAKMIGLTFPENKKLNMPCLVIEGIYGEHGPFAPDDWRRIFKEQATRIGWNTYGFCP